MRHIRSCRVLRPAGMQDCTGHGITARFTVLDVILDVPYLMTEFDGKEYFDRPDEKAVEEYARKSGLDPRTVVLLCDKRNNPIYSPYLKPLDSVYGVRDGRKLTGPCAGGNYVACREPGENEKVIRVHDRYDTQEAWDGLSR